MHCCCLCIICVQVSRVGEALRTRLYVRKVTFTGSTAVGKTLVGHAAKTVKKVTTLFQLVLQVGVVQYIVIFPIVSM
jgi:delta 1-pyrroline-5-carboxylate dehydrogenase